MDELFAGSAKVLNASTVGAMLVIVLIAYYYTVRMFRADIKELQTEVRSERAAHQKTIEAHIADVREMARMASAFDELRDKMVELAMRNKV